MLTLFNSVSEAGMQNRSHGCSSLQLVHLAFQSMVSKISKGVTDRGDLQLKSLDQIKHFPSLTLGMISIVAHCSHP